MKNIEELRCFCLSLPETTEDMPFGEDFLVFRICGKLFAIVKLDDIPLRVNLKCNPALALELRAEYPEVMPGYHMNKKHWNTVYVENLPDVLMRKMIIHSYEEVITKLPKKMREELPYNFENPFKTD